MASVPTHATVVGVPGRVVTESGEHSDAGTPMLTLDHGALPDPVVRALTELRERVAHLESGSAVEVEAPVNPDEAELGADELGKPERER